MCQRPAETNHQILPIMDHVVEVSFDDKGVNTVVCPAGHRTLSYLQCNDRSQCLTTGTTNVLF